MCVARLKRSLFFASTILFLFSKASAQSIDLSQVQSLPNILEDSRNPIPSVIVLDQADESEIISINADGEGGAVAMPAIFWGSTPEAGTSGSSGGQITLIVRRLPKEIRISARGGDGGAGGAGAPGQPGHSGLNGRNGILFHPARNGQDGQDGQDGGDGSPGGNGGNGGSVRIFYVPDSPENYDPNWKDHFKVDVSGGRGGRGGPGGDGGRGGRGGKGGRRFLSSKHRPNGKDGQKALPGISGLDGMNGEMGNLEMYEKPTMQDCIVDDYLSDNP